jgi:AraC-like DNA-binding protein
MCWENRYKDGEREIWHSHEQGQLVCPTTGLVRVVTSVGAWITPPGQALWIAPGTDHELHMVGQVRLYSLVIEPDTTPWLWKTCRMLAVSPLLQELIVTMGNEPFEYAPGSASALAAPLALHCLNEAAQIEDGKLPLPKNKRLLQICERLMLNPANNEALETLGYKVGASARTLARLFKAETGMTFGQWRQQARLSKAICMLAQGSPISHIARKLGYTNANAFSAMFQRALSISPTSYMRDKFSARR